nr:cytochrome d ubiquinol oxidase subunit II [Kushneria phosphatilytica]
MTMTIDLPLIWYFLIGFAVAMYVVMDGFSLGVGILYPFFKNDAHRDVMMNTTSPVWDGNQTWMILGGAGLYGAFPLAYATFLPALYLPLILMLLSLIFRGIAFEFRFKSTRSRKWFDLAFSGGSIVATFSQGMVLGGIINGLDVENRTFTGGPFDWFSPFALFIGVALIIGYALLGATWLIMKTEGSLQRRCYQLARPLTILMVLCTIIVGIWTPLDNSRVAERWFTFPNILWFSPVPVLVVLLAWSIWDGVTHSHERRLFLKVLGLFFLGLSGLVISYFPLIIPPNVTLWDAASSRSSQLFLVIGYAVLVPIVLSYTAYSYYVFRGKVREGDGYH